MIFRKDEKTSCNGKMIVNIMSALVVMTAFVFGNLLLFSHPDLYSSFEYKMLAIAQTDESIGSSSFS